MRFLADESCDFAVVRALRTAGHDVLPVADFAGGAPDDRVIDLALEQGRVLLTEDRDFGRLLYAQGARAAGVVFIRFPAAARVELGNAVTALVDRLGERLNGKFVVLQPGRARVTEGP